MVRLEDKAKKAAISAHYKTTQNYAKTGRAFSLTRERIRQVVAESK